MYNVFETTTSLMPSTTAYGSTNFTLTDEGEIDKKHLGTIIGSYSALTSTYGYQCYKHDAVLRKFAEAQTAENYVESLSDQELELALQKLGVLEDAMNENNSTKKI